ncbi:MFS transporter [Desulfovibrio subterraneus]|uniref:MFS transporter n=1 Tax=Desulfovibrio subterraneus TaxID=2718620 RepID=UPI0022B88D45|nr:MFS transporter [Desulfovibrio subterraneus]WBF67901.1 MFS transporter [Desulfovibrio subterraneus]
MSTADQTTSTPPFSRALPWILFITFMFFLNQTSRMLLAPMLVPLQDEFNLSYTDAGALLLFTSAGNAFSVFCSGFLSSRLRHRYVIPLSIGCYGLALTFLSFASSLDELRIGFTLCGMSGGMYFPSGLAALGSIADRKDWGKTISVHELAPNLAFIVAPTFAEIALQFTDWRGALQAMGGIAVTGALLFLFKGRGGNFHGEPPGKSTVPSLLKRRETWLFVLIIGVAVAMEWAPYSIMPLFLVNAEGMDRTSANALMAVTRIPTPFMALAGGWLTDRMGEERILVISFAGSIVAVMLVPAVHGQWLTMTLFMQAALPPLMFPAIFKMFANAFSPTERSLVLSMTMPLVAFLAAGGAPAMIGFCGDLGSFGAGFIILGLAGVVCLPAIRNFGRMTSQLDR